MDSLLAATRVSKRLGTTQALGEVSLTIAIGEVVAVVGPSGCGKSTLLQVLAGLLAPDDGTVTFRGSVLSELPDRARSAIRLRHFGFAFQFGELVPELTLLENVELPLRLTGVKASEARQRGIAILDGLELGALAARRPQQVSGGQAQRAAIARAMVHAPAVLFADEPTGALDSKSGAGVLSAMLGLTREKGTSVVLVTHDHNIATQCDRILEMQDGSLLPSSGERES